MTFVEGSNLEQIPSALCPVKEGGPGLGIGEGVSAGAHQFVVVQFGLPVPAVGNQWPLGSGRPIQTGHLKDGLKNPFTKVLPGH